MKAEVTHCLIEIAPAILATDLLISFFATPEVSFYILVTNMLILAPNWAYLNPRRDQKLGRRDIFASCIPMRENQFGRPEIMGSDF